VTPVRAIKRLGAKNGPGARSASGVKDVSSIAFFGGLSAQNGSPGNRAGAIVRRFRSTSAAAPKPSSLPVKRTSSFVKRRQVLSRLVELLLDGVCSHLKDLARQSLTIDARAKPPALSRPFVSRLNVETSNLPPG
jgi:hypothetical protein